jgi:hypothetical protein
MKRLALASLVAVTTITSLGSGPVFAQTSKQPKDSTARCVKLTHKIEARTTKISAHLTKSEATYTKHDAKVQTLITKAKTAGLNTDKAQADLQTWQSQTAAIHTAKNQVVTKLNTAKSLPCSDDPSAVKAAISGAKEQVKAIEGLKQTKQSYFKNTMKPDLKALRDQLKTKAN